MIKLLSINVSLPKEVVYKGKTIRTSIYKEPVEGRIKVNRLNLEGDGQADLIGHGGEMRAVYVYSFNNYKSWEDELNRNNLQVGQFGENFTVEGMLDHDIHIGDQFKIGSALFEVSQPRVPCYKLAMKMGIPDFYNRILRSGRLGFYFRVLQEGEIGAGDEIIPFKINRTNGMTITDVNELMYFDKQNYKGFERALTFKALSPGWRDTFKDRLLKRDREEQGLKAFDLLTVTKIVDESETIRSFYLQPKDKRTEPFQAGQFLPVKLDIPGQYKSIDRNYTISNAPGEGFYRLSIKREDTPANDPDAYPGVSSNYFHKQVKEGDNILAARPRGKFLLDNGNHLPIVFISAGVGITPMISMLEFLLKQKDSRKVYFMHGARNGKEHSFKDKIQHIEGTIPHVNSLIAYSRPISTDRLGKDYHLEGRLNLDIIKENLKGKPDFNFYVCGPNRFMKDILFGLMDWGVPLGHIHFELFNTTPSDISLNSFLKAGSSNREQDLSTEISVNFVDSGTEVPWDDAFDNILEFAESKGLTPDFSCRAGVCQTCITDVIAGEVTYDPEPLQEPEKGKIFICCSRPTENLHLKL